VFIVGAGASCEFGLPMGSTLTKQIKDKLQLDGNNYRTSNLKNPVVNAALDRLLNANFSGTARWKIKEDFAKQIYRYSDVHTIAPSIDNYLEANRGDKVVELMGKLGIAACLLEAEQSSPLGKTRNGSMSVDLEGVKDTWLTKLALFLNEGINPSNAISYFNNVSFITFNYDRCIEHFFHTAVKSYFANLGTDTVAEILARMDVHHVYGSLGEYDGTFGFRDPSPPYQALSLVGATANLRTFGESEAEEERNKTIDKIMSQADTLVFLGFSFNSTNMKILTPPEHSIRRVFFTSYGMSEANTKAHAEMLSRTYLQDPKTVYVSREYLPTAIYEASEANKFLDNFKVPLLAAA
jgi:NAD-dependent SIR2 family protein deacetylase